MKAAHRRKPQPPTRSRKPQTYRPSGAVSFRQARGKTLEDVYLTTDTDLNCITLVFNDKTEMVFDIETSFSVQADYSDWKTGNQEVLRRWPRIRSAPSS